MTGFATDIAAAYATDGPAIDLGRGMLGGAVAPEAVVRAPLALMNRHGLIAEAAIDFLKSSEGKRLVRGVFGMLRKRL